MTSLTFTASIENALGQIFLEIILHSVSCRHQAILIFLFHMTHVPTKILQNIISEIEVLLHVRVAK